MTPLETALVATLWVVLGLFICSKADWFKECRDDTSDETPFIFCIVVIGLAPIAFLWDFINRFFIQKWH